MAKPCHPNEHEPDIVGICKLCGWEVATPVDDDGTPLPYNVYDDCFCTENQIVVGCTLHDVETIEPKGEIK